MSSRILVVDDELSIRTSLAGILEDEGYAVSTAKDGQEALEIIRQVLPAVVLLDIWMPRMDGIKALKRIKGQWPQIEVIMISGHGTIETAVTAIKLGAYDFIEKPLSLEKTMLIVEHALERQRLEQENRELRQEVEKGYEMVGQGAAIEALRRQIELVAPTDGRVLIYGENGTGKELIARAIHHKSPQHAGPFVEVNCAAIPEELIESELFGHERGAFTGATATHIGKFEQAHKGTLFLDEIGDMSLKTQSKVLRVIEEQTFERVGGKRKISVNVRLIAASNKNLEEEIRKGNFREDLFYRLNVVPFHVSPLRERKEDIPLLVKHYLDKFCRKNGKRGKGVSPEAMSALVDYPWPGNVRELKNIVERMVIMVPGDVIDLADIPDGILQQGSALKGEYRSLKEAREIFERDFILKVLKENGNNITQAAKELRIERSHLHRKLRAYGIGRNGD